MLILAWALGNVVKDVQTAEYLSGALETGIQAYMLPAMISVSSARKDKQSFLGRGSPQLYLRRRRSRLWRSPSREQILLHGVLVPTLL